MRNAPKNAWYVAGHAAELDHGPVGRTIMGNPVVLYKTESGAFGALHDRCPHRAAPLSHGRVRGENLICGYHGASFDAEGHCHSETVGSVTPAQCAVKSYPVLKYADFIWIWTGDKDKATGIEVLPPFFAVADADNAETTDGGYVSAKANYMLFVDNLLDGSHAEFVHPTTLGYEGLSEIRDPSKATFELEPRENGVKFTITQKADIAGKAFHDALARSLGRDSYDEPIDWKVISQWQAPSCHVFNSITKEIDAPDATALEQHTLHAITPETDTTCHYFVKQVELQESGKPRLNDFWTEATFKAFDEDKTIIEAQQAAMGKASKLATPGWNMFESDALGTMGRGIVESMVAAEKSSGESAAP